jgi:DNA-binding NtrC family response regulator
VDDEEMLARSCESILSAEGYAVHRELRGRSALDYVRRSRPDFVLLDVKLPDLDGVSVLKEIKLMAPDTLVVMMTGSATLGGSIEAVQAGAWEYMPKPFTATQLRVLAGRAAGQLPPRTPVLPAPPHPPEP